MTFSIVATDGSAYGVAVASKFLAVGAAVPAAESGVGAIATQATANLGYRPAGLALLRAGRSAQQTIDTLTAADGERAHRQVGVVDRHGGAASYTGAACLPWAGGLTGPSHAIQGNILAGEQVVTAMQSAWQSSDPALPLAHRLMMACSAGDDAGGDRRGRQSAALLVVSPGGGYGGGSDVLVDLRVDDDREPVPELCRLLELHGVYFGKPDPAAALALAGPLRLEVARLLDRLGFGPDAEGGVERPLAEWAGIENYEERLVPGRIDPVVLAKLREAGTGR